MNPQQYAWDRVAANVQFTLQPDLEWFAKAVPCDGVVLDYGCGYGRVCNDLYVRGFKNLLGVDCSSAMITRGKSTYAHLKLQHTSDYQIPAPSNHFDGVIVCAVLTCLPVATHRRAVVDEIARVLKPGGKAYILEFQIAESMNYDEGGTFLSSLGVRMKHFTRIEMESELSPLKLIESAVIPTMTLAGHETNAIHCLAGKS